MNKDQISALIEATKEFKKKMDAAKIDVSITGLDHGYNGTTFIIDGEQDDTITGVITVKGVRLDCFEDLI